MAGMRYQPQGRAQLDCSPIARGIVGAFVASNPGADIFGAAVRLAGGLAPVATPTGLLLGGFTASTGIYAEIDQPKMSGAFSIAFSLLFQRRGGTQSFVAQGGSGSGNGWAVSSNANSDALLFTLGGIASYTISNSALIPGEVNRVVVRISGNGGTARAWVNGMLVGTTAIGSMRTPASSGTLIGVARQTAAYVDALGPRSAVGDVILYDRALTDDEGISLSSNLYQVFADPAFDDDFPNPQSYAVKVQAAELAIGGNSARMAVARRLRVQPPNVAIDPGQVPMRASRRISVAPALLVIAGSQVGMQYSQKQTPASYTLPVSAASMSMGSGNVSMRVARCLPVTPARLDLAVGQVRALVRRRMLASSARLELVAGSVTLRLSMQSAPVDISKIHLSRIVIFGGSGSRVTPFEGSGSRVTPFEGSGSRVTEFE